MNLFELIVTDPSHYQQISNEASVQQNHWGRFKQNVGLVIGGQINEVEAFMARSKDLWAAVVRSTPELVPIMIEYYHSKDPPMQMNSID
jgi:hypothetical protein